MPSVSFDFRNTNSLWCSVLVETLAHCGVREAVLSPGSRSTPLTFAFVAHADIETIPVLDERSAAFFALGLAKQHRRPVVLICTSGTAGANYFPAVIEAQESNVPLIVITADRPPEMRECASGQTIDQLRLFGSHVNWFHELAVPEASLGLLRYLRQTVAHAVERSLLPSAGPVHLNAPFRDPLPPIPNDSAKPLEGQLNADFFDHLGPTLRPSPGGVLWQRPTTTRGLIIAGADTTADPKAYTESVLRLAESLGWPVLADALSPLRHYTAAGGLVQAGYDAILRSARLARELTPRTVLCLGGWPTSKVLRAWLEQSGAEIALVSPHVANRDALHGRTRHIVASAEQLAPVAPAPKDQAYSTLWQAAEAQVQRTFDELLAVSDLVEPRATRELAELLPPGTPVFVASSMPVRDIEYFWPVNSRGVRLFFNRGANGIDGTLSTAFGVAHGGAPAVLLTGDLALLHDTNGFLHQAKFRGSLTIILINNRGGGIFQHLPVAQFDPPFEDYFATPQEVDFGRLCGAYGVEHREVKDWAHFRTLVQSLEVNGVRVLELKTDRKRDAAFRKTLFAKAATAAERTT